MRSLGLALIGAAALEGCEAGSVKLGTDTADTAPVEEGCKLVSYVPADCATDACPAIAHADELVDLRTSVFGRITNAGDLACEEAEAELQLDGSSLGTQVVPALAPGEEFVAYNDGVVFTETDTSEPGATHDLNLIVNGEESGSYFTARNGVGCIVKGHLLEYVQKDQRLSVDDCTVKPFDDINTYNPYCGAITAAQDSGWVTGEQDLRDIDSDGDTGETVYDAWTCANMATASAVLVRAYGLREVTDQYCPDVDSSEWYATYMNTLQAQTGLLADEDGNCNPTGDLIRPKLEVFLNEL